MGTPIPAGRRKRCLVVTKEINAEISGASSSSLFGDVGRGIAGSLLRGFICGGRIRVNREFGRSEDADLRQLVQADELWELCFRYGGLIGGSRLLGRFR